MSSSSEGMTTHEMHIQWSKPTNLGIEWPKTQTIPQPAREVLQAEADWQTTRDPWGLLGIDYGQTFVEAEGRDVLWSGNYSWYLEFGLMKLTAYCSKSTHYISPAQKYLVENGGKGSWIADPSNNDDKYRLAEYGYVVRYFFIGCQHDYQEYSPRMFEHHYKCKKCGFEYEVDSSG